MAASCLSTLGGPSHEEAHGILAALAGDVFDPAPGARGGAGCVRRARLRSAGSARRVEAEAKRARPQAAVSLDCLGLWRLGVMVEFALETRPSGGSLSVRS
jgi:hypothetical protein